MEKYEEKYEHSNPLFPMCSYYVYKEEWERLKQLGAKIVPQESLDTIKWMEEDGDASITYPVIEFQGKRYDRFLGLIKEIHGDQTQKLIDSWNQELQKLINAERSQK
jgi:hypothetical protein